MKELEGAVAVITGAASGIGRATAERFAERGMKVVLADIEEAPLDDAASLLRRRGFDAVGVPTDVTKWDSVAALAERAVAEYGTINVAFLNAGVTGGGAGLMTWEIELKDWEWPLAVNVWGVIHGIKALVPPIVENGEPGHVVITSSSVGVVAPTASGPAYNLSKASGCSLAETLQGQFRTQGLPISASVLVPPGTINTGLFTGERNRQPEYQPAVPRPAAPTLTYDELLERMNKAGNPRRPVEPEEVATYVMEAIEADRFWILPDERHEDMRDQFDAIIRARAASMLARSDPMSYMQKNI